MDVVFDPVQVVDEDREVCYNEEGNLEIGRLSKFPIHWCSGHYDYSPIHYHTPSDSMGVEDEESFGVLNRFVDGFFPSRWVTREGHDILEEDGEPTFEAHPINTKALVECRTYGQAVNLLGFCSRDLLYFYF